MKTRSLGSTGLTVSAIGLGAMGMSDAYGPTDRGESIGTVHAALDAGVTLIDTGDFYGMGHNEMLLAEALKGRRREDYVLSVKFGALRDPRGAFVGIDTSPAALKSALAYSLKRLGTDYVDIYRPARLDPSVPIEDTIGAVAEMVQAGHVRHIGLSEVGADTIRRAAAVHPIADLQIEYSLITRGPERAIMPVLDALGIGMTPYGVLARGLISGHWRKEGNGPGDFRVHGPRFSGDNLDHNLELVERIRAVAEAIGASVAQVAIAWVLAKGPRIVPVIGARTRQRLAESLGALDIALDSEHVAALDAALPPDSARGTRYDAAQMAMLDSERT